ncbi:hypothetical protein K439DRAFT_1640806, partial [Ramaria rubella]
MKAGLFVHGQPLPKADMLTGSRFYPKRNRFNFSIQWHTSSKLGGDQRRERERDGLDNDTFDISQ